MITLLKISYLASHPVIIVRCTKLDAACDQQATVHGQLLTTLGNNQRAFAKLFLVHRLGKAPEGITLMFGDMLTAWQEITQTSPGRCNTAHINIFRMIARVIKLVVCNALHYVRIIACTFDIAAPDWLHFIGACNVVIDKPVA